MLNLFLISLHFGGYLLIIYSFIGPPLFILFIKRWTNIIEMSAKMHYKNHYLYYSILAYYLY